MELELSQVDCSIVEQEFYRKNEVFERKKRKDLLIMEKKSLEQTQKQLEWCLTRCNMEKELQSQKLKRVLLKKSEIRHSTRK